jgi:hypothetical protein
MSQDRSRMLVPRVTFVGLVVAIALAFAGLWLTTTRAQAHHVILSGVPTCIEEDGSWTVDWTATNSEDDKLMTIADVDLEGDTNTSGGYDQSLAAPTLSPTVVAFSGSATGESSQGASTLRVRLTVYATWTGANNTAQAVVYKPEDCTPPEATSTFTPTPEPTSTFTPTPEPTSTFTPTPEPTSTFTPTPDPTSTFTPTPEPTSTFTPTPQRGSIRIIKDTDPETDDIEFDFDGSFPDFDLEDDQSVTFDDLEADSYTIEEDEGSEWNLSAISCNADDYDVSLGAERVVVHLQAGEDVTCTFNNVRDVDPTSTASPQATSTSTPLATLTAVPTATSLPISEVSPTKISEELGVSTLPSAGGGGSDAGAPSTFLLSLGLGAIALAGFILALPRVRRTIGR